MVNQMLNFPIWLAIHCTILWSSCQIITLQILSVNFFSIDIVWFLGVANHDADSESRAPSVSASPQDPGTARGGKTKPRKKHKRRNSEPMGKLQRGQKQVKGECQEDSN